MIMPATLRDYDTITMNAHSLQYLTLCTQTQYTYLPGVGVGKLGSGVF